MPLVLPKQSLLVTATLAVGAPPVVATDHQVVVDPGDPVPRSVTLPATTSPRSTRWVRSYPGSPACTRPNPCQMRSCESARSSSSTSRLRRCVTGWSRDWSSRQTRWMRRCRATSGSPNLPALWDLAQPRLDDSVSDRARHPGRARRQRAGQGHAHRGRPGRVACQPVAQSGTPPTWPGCAMPG
jgi:hypothetical protein